MDLSTPTPATTSSTTVATRDNVYCLELAKRSVARAALHLGIPSMTEDVLNVLGDVLCEYLQRLAAVLAQNVESSGRSTQHVNTLDTLRAVELCTSPAVTRVHFTSTSNSGTATNHPTSAASATPNGSTNHHHHDFPNANTTSSSSHNNDDDHNGNSHSTNNNPRDNNNTPSHPPGSWQGLAAFCFGPNWQEDTLPEDLEVAELQGAGGKVGPKAVNQQDEAAKDCQEGWRAPFPDEVPPFPLCPTSVSNPHAMSQTQVLQALYGPLAPPESPTDLIRGPNWITSEQAEQERQGMESVLSGMPESAWGGLNSSSSSNPNNNNARRTTSAKSDAANSDDAAAAAAKATDEGTAGKRKSDDKDDDDTGDDANNPSSAAAASAATSSSDDKKLDSNTSDDKDKEDASGQQPPKKKVKLEDGSSAPASKSKATTTTPKKKKKDDKDDAASAKNSETNNPQDSTTTKDDTDETMEDAATKANSTKATGPTYNYVPTFLPPIPTMAVGDNVAKLRKTTVVDLLEQQAAAAAAAAAGGTTEATTQAQQHQAATLAGQTASFGLRSALVQLGGNTSTFYWGSQADAPAPATTTSDDVILVPVGRSTAPLVPAAPIVPLGRASGSRVSRILEGSMDAAVLQQ